jgi:hypothetical protein
VGVAENTPYCGNSSATLGDQVKGKKNGTTYKFYFADPGVSSAGTAVSASDYRTTQENEVSLTLDSEKTVVDIAAVDNLTKIEDVAKTVVRPRAAGLSSGIEKRVIAGNAHKSSLSIVTTALTVSDLGWATASLQNARVNSEISGFINALDQRVVAISNMQNTFQVIPEISNALYKKLEIGNFGNAMWYNTPAMPVITTGLVIPASGVTVDGLVNTDGATSIVTQQAAGVFPSAGTIKAGTTFKVAGVNATDLLGFDTNEQFVFTVTSDVTVAAGALTLTLPVLPMFFAGGGKNVSAAIADDAVISGAGMAAASSYRLIQIRTKDSFEFNQYEFPDIPGCVSSSEAFGNMKIKGTASGNAETMNAFYRWDVPFIAGMKDIRQSRTIYVKI